MYIYLLLELISFFSILGGQQDCEHLELPGCPPDGCLTTEQHQSYQRDFAGCPTPCDICEAGRCS